MEEAGLLPIEQRGKIAADVSTAISELADERNLDHLRLCAQACQAERWRLVAAGANDLANVHFARVMITEQWLLARVELLSPGSPIREILAERRCRAVEEFVRGSFKTAEIIPLHRKPRNLSHADDASKAAA
jgi:hypothetical protein